MGNNKKTSDKSRRDFFSIFMASDKKSKSSEMVKMLTADGKLVEVSKAMLDEVTKKQKSTNKEIYDWMNNPSKETNS